MATNSLQDQTPKQYLRSMQLVHIALLVGMIVFAGVTYYMNPSTEVNFSESGAFLFVVPIVIGISFTSPYGTRVIVMNCLV